MARGWRIIARDVAQTAGFWVVLGLMTYLGMSALSKIEATRTRLFLVVVVLSVAFSAASLLAHLLRDCPPTEIQPNGEPTEICPRWYSHSSEPIVSRRSDRVPYSYVVLPRR